jgi:nicotinate-nucleotide adenylyltransferase
MRLGLFGGTFDPVHYGHLLLAESAREQCKLERVLFLPAAIPPHKQGLQPTPPAVRIEMLELAIAGHEAFAVSRYEVERGGVNYTADTLAHFRQQDPDGELFFLMGADMLHDLPHWHQPERICRLAIPVVAARPGVGEPDFDCLRGVTTPERIETMRRCVVRMPLIGLSGTEIRRRVAEGLSIRYQTPRAVEKYIQTHGVYA